MSWGCPPGLQQIRDCTKPASDRERRYQLRRSQAPTDALSPGNRSAQDWDRVQFEHHPKESQERHDGIKSEEASQRHGQKYDDLQATVENAPDAPTSLTGEGNLHQREYASIISPSSISFVETEIISPEIVQRYHCQVELFQTLERSCTAAA
ncbi:hypothetical protein MMC27_001031 [Xylographa pallens]|nr:hypothetical protein [Xylographa pallens]